MKPTDTVWSIDSPTMRDAAGFTLIELLLVIGITVAVISMVAPTITSVANGSHLTSAGQLLGDQIALARQEAIATNRDVELRLINFGTGTSQSWRAIQIWRIEQASSGTTTFPVTRMMTLPTGVVISPNATLSPLLTASSLTSGTINVPGSTTRATYSGFRIRANGVLESAVNWTNNYLTLRNENTLSQPLGDYYTIQVNPITGKGIAYRP